jgi:serine/threonine-protein kinase
LAPSIISHYEILEKLGEGGMGTVYKARDLKLDRMVALKFLPLDLTRDPEAKLRFLHEARTPSSLQHKNICVVYDIDETEDGQMFISMECLEGETLDKRIGAGSLSLQESVNIASQVAAGLAKAHESAIVHCDVKPANIMIARDGSAKILDFGLAKARSNPAVAMPGTLLGTVAYMSPEQARGDPVDQRTDIWSLGVILYEMITGQRPFPSDYPQAAMYALMHERHPSPRAARPEIPLTLERVIDRCLEKSAAERFHDAGALLNALRRIGHDSRGPREITVRSIAVLPFTDISPEKDNKYFSDGLTEEIISKLSRLQNVKIVSRGSVMYYERAGKTTRQIAAELNVQYLLEGSVRTHGPSLRITTQLIDADRDAYLWAETYNGTMDEIFDIQEDVAGRIVKALKVRLTPDDRRTLKRRATDNTAAYQLYLKGRFFWSKRTKEGFLAAIRCFQEAIEKDPRHAPSWAGIADSYLLLNEFVGMPGKETYPEAKAAVHKALEIDDRLAEPHTSLGLLAMLSEWDWETAEKEFRLALSASPSYVTAHHWYAELLVMLGRAEEAISEISRAVELDPLSPAALKDFGLILYYTREYNGAIELARKALELNPDFASVHRLLSLAYQAQGKHAEAIAEHGLWTEKSDMGFEGTAALAQCYAVAGRKEEALELLGRCPPRESARGNLARSIALAHAGLGETDLAFTWLERAYETKAEAMGMLLVDPKMDPLRSDARFASLLARVGLDR